MRSLAKDTSGQVAGEQPMVTSQWDSVLEGQIWAEFSGVVFVVLAEPVPSQATVRIS